MIIHTVNGLLVVTAVGVTAGAHRLWTHRSYKAKLPLRIFLAACQSVAGQNCLLIWCRDHRVHHKFSDTDADPHNIKRGVFFSHVGWLLRKKHPAVREFGARVSIEDLKDDPVIRWQARLYYPIYLIFSLALPVAIPVMVWNESLVVSFFTSYIFRTAVVLHDTWFVNSAAHFIGHRPFDPSIEPVENSLVSFFTIGEGYHNYHHVFPFDYKAGEFGSMINATRFFIEAMAMIGQAYDLKLVKKETVDACKERAKLKRTNNWADGCEKSQEE